MPISTGAYTNAARNGESQVLLKQLLIELCAYRAVQLVFHLPIAHDWASVSRGFAARSNRTLDICEIRAIAKDN